MPTARRLGVVKPATAWAGSRAATTHKAGPQASGSHLAWAPLLACPAGCQGWPWAQPAEAMGATWWGGGWRLPAYTHPSCCDALQRPAPLQWLQLHPHSPGLSRLATRGAEPRLGGHAALAALGLVGNVANVVRHLRHSHPEQWEDASAQQQFGTFSMSSAYAERLFGQAGVEHVSRGRRFAATCRPAAQQQPHLADVRGGRSSGVGVARLALLEHAGVSGGCELTSAGRASLRLLPPHPAHAPGQALHTCLPTTASSGTHRGAAGGQCVGRLCGLAGRHLWRHVAPAGPVLACRRTSVEAAGAKAGQGQGLGRSGGRLQPAVAAVCLQQQGGAARAASQDGSVGGAPGRAGFRGCNVPRSQGA